MRNGVSVAMPDAFGIRGLATVNRSAHPTASAAPGWRDRCSASKVERAPPGEWFLSCAHRWVVGITYVIAYGATLFICTIVSQAQARTQFIVLQKLNSIEPVKPSVFAPTCVTQEHMAEYNVMLVIENIRINAFAEKICRKSSISDVLRLFFCHDQCSGSIFCYWSKHHGSGQTRKFDLESIKIRSIDHRQRQIYLLAPCLGSSTATCPSWPTSVSVCITRSKRWGYAPNFVARSMRSRTTQTIGWIVREIRFRRLPHQCGRRAAHDVLHEAS
jgi:hypothetical protein